MEFVFSKPLLTIIIPIPVTSTKQIRKQLAELHYYMKNVAKGDVAKLCEHTRELTYENYK